MGRFSDEEAQVEGFYLAHAMEIVGALWETHTPGQIAQAIRLRTGYPASQRLVCSLRQRLDRRTDQSAD